ncbi:CotY/CotZ family spore coat protein [Metabacillus endolithicus]|uniref:CotY/CotZ family spore coat protein n=1 Tax=Metabacillus endolithicus TaxID=1535204 RepID=A0ABW5C0P8_9BACI|nr:CotY/CotZ family spore coat protein [Metabacillus endolithicus]UPG62419.1 spore coat protein [Metabacillus endolithicus]
MKDHYSFNCVCDAVENILNQQKAVEDEKCPTSCYSNLLNPVKTLGDTIPFLLLNEKGQPFQAFGNVGENCFETNFFRVEGIHDCCATLRLLLPLDCHGHLAKEICDVKELVKTRNCVEVDLSCFCAIQCLSPRLIAG